MQDCFKKRSALLAPRLIKNLEERQFEACYCATTGEAVEKVLSLITEESTVSWGGSMTLRETGLLDALYKKSEISLIDRDTGANQEERRELMRQALLCDYYLTSVNAISEDGILVNVDNLGNRVAALTFGPRYVIVIAGMNKVCKSMDDALTRARTYAAPVNAQRVSLTKTPCAKTGACHDCKSEECICSTIALTRFCKTPGRVKIVLVGEILGF